MNLIRGHHRDMARTAVAALQGLMDYDQRVRNGQHTSDGLETFPLDEGSRLQEAKSIQDYLQNLLDATI